mmetsp:Transcript_11797/g.35395  ORF Transcript_11797/g.35395 Transcript_11797/m.35395 type:complete len:608 (+) Transcript_11797:53-1876(+)
MNPNAPAFSFNPGASDFTPTPPPPAPQETWEDEEEDIDESDPLWIVTLRLAAGDRAKALKMLEDPDALMVHPEVIAALGNGDDAAETETETETVPADVIPPDVPPEDAPPEAEERAEEPEAQSAQSAQSAQPEELTEEDPRPHLNLVFIGHVDAGKSTLSGNILYLTDHVDKRTIEKYEREAKQRNRESWFLAFIMDTNEEERAKGKTVEVGRAPFSTAEKRYTILDAPGHKNYVPHMISGAAQADVGILVISARRGEFETGFERGGQTREHAMLAKTLGVRYLVVVVNKMDDPTVQWSKARYDECVTKLRPFLKSCGYTIKKEVKFLAVSGLTGANVLEPVRHEACDWWEPLCAAKANNTEERTLLACLDHLAITGRSAESPLRVPVLDRYKDGGTVALGKVETGRITLGDTVVVMPTGTRTKVESIVIGETNHVRSAKPGENVALKLSNVGVEDVAKGFVLCSPPPARPCPAVTTFIAQIALVELLEHRPVFTAGYDCVLHAHTCETEVTVTRLVEQVNAPAPKKNAPPTKKRQAIHFAKQGAVVVAVLTVPQSICVEAYDDVEQLGRFTLRDEGKSIAIGKVLSLTPRSANNASRRNPKGGRSK